MAIRLARRDNQIIDAFPETMRLFKKTKHKRLDIQNVSYIVKTTVDASDGSLHQVTPCCLWCFHSLERSSSFNPSPEGATGLKAKNTQKLWEFLMGCDQVGT